MANEIIRYLPRTDLRSGHDGLAKIALKAGINPKTLEPGQFIVFLNRAKTAMKIYAANNLVVHYKSPTNWIDIRTFQFIPQAFSGGKFNYSVALRRVIEIDFKKRGLKA